MIPPKSWGAYIGWACDLCLDSAMVALLLQLEGLIRVKNVEERPSQAEDYACTATIKSTAKWLKTGYRQGNCRCGLLKRHVEMRRKRNSPGGVDELVRNEYASVKGCI
jgi:hypothetical protein